MISRKIGIDFAVMARSASICLVQGSVSIYLTGSINPFSASFLSFLLITPWVFFSFFIFNSKIKIPKKIVLIFFSFQKKWKIKWHDMTWYFSYDVSWYYWLFLPHQSLDKQCKKKVAKCFMEVYLIVNFYDDRSGKFDWSNEYLILK